MQPKPARIALVAFACAGALALAPAAFAHEGHDHAAPAAKPATDAGHDAAAAEMMKHAAPGSEHKALEAMAGTWKAKLKAWFAPGAPTESEGTMVNTMILGGRVLEGRFTGSFMGMPMTGVSMMGFDNAKQEYWALWTDDMSTAGSWQTGGPAKGGPIALRGMTMGMDGKPMEMGAMTKVVDADTHVYTMTTKMKGKDMPLMEITYTRAK